jgi:hypothetical protein
MVKKQREMSINFKNLNVEFEIFITGRLADPLESAFCCTPSATVTDFRLKYNVNTSLQARE